jgi:hypothetical protein
MQLTWTQHIAAIPLLFTLLAGCTTHKPFSDEFTLYVFRDASNSCAQEEGAARKENLFVSRHNCTMQAYGEMEISVQKEAQRVTAVLRPLQGEPQFLDLTDCKVVDKENFQCRSLVMIDGALTSKSVALDGISSSYVAYLLARAQGGLPVSWVLFLSEYDKVIRSLAAIAAVIAFMIICSA